MSVDPDSISRIVLMVVSLMSWTWVSRLVLIHSSSLELTTSSTALRSIRPNIFSPGWTIPWASGNSWR